MRCEATHNAEAASEAVRVSSRIGIQLGWRHRDKAPDNLNGGVTVLHLQEMDRYCEGTLCNGIWVKYKIHLSGRCSNNFRNPNKTHF